MTTLREWYWDLMEPYLKWKGGWVEAGRPCWYLRWGRIGIWQKDKWAVEFHFPYIRYQHWKHEVFLCADTTLRLNWLEKAAAVQVLGFAVAFTLTPQGIKHYRNSGVCYHGVSLDRKCEECTGQKKETRP